MTDASDSEPAGPPLERAEELLARLERRATLEAVRLAARAIEEAQDLWSDAQALRRRSTTG